MEAFTFLQSPKKVFTYCLVIFAAWLFASGYLFHAYRLSVLDGAVQKKIDQITSEMSSIQIQLSRSQDREFIRKQAIENLGLAGEHDLIFLFPQ